MKMVKSLILGSAATLIAFGGAQAADLPVKAKAVEYVKICSLYGAGFWYIPGTDTCIKLGGHIRFDAGFGTGNTYDVAPIQGGANGLSTRGRDNYQTRARIAFQEDTRTATEYGVVRTFADVKFQWANTSDNLAGGNAEVDFAFIQFAGFTAGKAVSFFDPQWLLQTQTISSYILGGHVTNTGLPLLAYTASFGNGVSGSISLEDGSRAYNRAGIWNTTANIYAPGSSTGAASAGGPFALATYTFSGNAEGGAKSPDIVGAINVDQAWGSLHFGAALHNVSASYYGAVPSDALGHPDDKWGFALTGAFEIKNIPTGANDSLKVSGTYAEGAAKYVFGGTFDGIGGGRVARASDSTLALGYVLDGVFTGASSAAANATGINLSTEWGVQAVFNHFWTPQWQTSLWGSVSNISYGGSSNAMIASLQRQFAFAPGLGGNTDLTIYEIGSTTSWSPVKDLTFSGEVKWTKIDQNLTGAYTFPGTSGKTGLVTLGDQDVVNGAFRVIRSF